MKKIIALVVMATGLCVFAPSVFSEEDPFGLGGLFDTLEDKEPAMEEEEVSTATAIRGLNPVSEEYGAKNKNLSGYVKDVKAMEKRNISERELRQFLSEEGLRRRIPRKR